MATPEHDEDRSVVSGRFPTPWVGYAGIGAFLLTLGAGISWRIGAPWPMLVAAVLLAILVGPPTLAY